MECKQEQEQRQVQERQQEQNNNIVMDVRECLKHVKSIEKRSKKTCLYGYCLKMQVDTGIIPKLTGDGDYLSSLRKEVDSLYFCHGETFVSNVQKLMQRKAGKILKIGFKTTCVFSTPNPQHLLVNVLLAKQEFLQFKFYVTRLVAFFQRVALEAGTTLHTVVVTCTVLKFGFSASFWIDNELEKPMPKPLTAHDMVRPLRIDEWDVDL